MTTKKKYKTEKDPETGLLRIIALKDFSDIKKGDRGGLIEKEENLSQEGNCWISGGAWVSGNAEVCGEAKVCGWARACGKANVSGNVKLWATDGYSYVSTSIESNKDYVILGTKAGFHIFSTSATGIDYIKNIQTIRQIYGEEV